MENDQKTGVAKEASRHFEENYDEEPTKGTLSKNIETDEGAYRKGRNNTRISKGRGHNNPEEAGTKRTNLRVTKTQGTAQGKVRLGEEKVLTWRI